MSSTLFPAASFDAVLCATCGGRCCQGHAGMWIDPQRFFAVFPALAGATPTELAERLPLELTLRDLLGVAVPAPLSGENGCVFLSAAGCRLAPHQRPCQCLALIPDVATQMEGEIRCRLQPGFGSDAAHALWLAHWSRSSR